MADIRGPVSIVRAAFRRSRYLLFRWRVQRANRAFDDVRGTDTAGSVDAADLDFDEIDRASASDYEAMHAGTLLMILDGLGIDYADYGFIDLGSGKGKAVMVAATLPFASATGVELSERLHRRAEANIERLDALGERRSGPARSFCGNALHFRITEPNAVVFLLNPFGADVMDGVVASLDAHFADPRARGVVIYSNPVEREVFESSSVFASVYSARRLAVYATAGAGIDPDRLERLWGTDFDRWTLPR